MTAKPEVFTRKASGLVRVMSPYSAFVYNILTMGLIFPVDVSVGARRPTWRQTWSGAFCWQCYLKFPLLMSMCGSPLPCRVLAVTMYSKAACSAAVWPSRL